MSAEKIAPMVIRVDWTDKTPCGFRFPSSGAICGVDASHPIHHMNWHGPEQNHNYNRNDRRLGHERRREATS